MFSIYLACLKHILKHEPMCLCWYDVLGEQNVTMLFTFFVFFVTF